MTTPEGLEIVEGYILDPQQKVSIDEALANLDTDTRFIPILNEVGALLSGTNPTALQPALYASSDPVPSRRQLGGISVVASTSPLARKELDTDYFSPHMQMRTKAEREQKRKFPRALNHRHSSYIAVNSSGSRDLYIDVDRHTPEEADGSHLSEEVLDDVARVFEFGHIVVGNTVVIGDGEIAAGVSLPTVVRELGQIIIPLPYSTDIKVRILKEVINELSQNRSPDYSKWRPTPARPQRPQRPKR